MAARVRSGHGTEGVFSRQVWTPALEKYGAVTHLTVALYGVNEQIVCGPVPPTPLAAVFEKYEYDPGIFAECARQCLAQAAIRPAVVVAPGSGLAVVGTSLVLGGAIVGAAVAGYALLDFSQASAIERLGRQAGVPFRRLWEVARQQQPVPEHRLELHGELLQVLGDAILRENYRTRQYEETAAMLARESRAKDEFLAVLSHELRTPLSPIIGWARILRDSEVGPDDRRKAAEAIERNALLQIKLVDDLLDLNQAVRGKLPLEIAVLDLSVLMRAAVDTLAETAAAKEVNVDVAEGSDPVMVEGDAVRLLQVLSNILSNAIKFTPAGGGVAVGVEGVGETAVVRISDTGQGIPREFLPHVFDMFRQHEDGARKRHPGLGIGLALVKRIVDLHHGDVEVFSGGAGHGTEVVVKLPLAAQASRERQKDASSPSAKIRKTHAKRPA